jgi:hypothetical protein
MTLLHLDLRADVGCRGNVSTHARPSASVRSVETMDIHALCRCPGPVIFPLYNSFLISYKQPERILPIRDILQPNFWMLREMSGVDLNRSETSHRPSGGLDS